MKKFLLLTSMLFSVSSVFADGIPGVDYLYQCKNATDNGDSSIRIEKSFRDDLYLITVGNIGSALNPAQLDMVLNKQLPLVVADNYTAVMFTTKNDKLYAVATVKSDGFTQTLMNCELTVSP